MKGTCKEHSSQHGYSVPCLYRYQICLWGLEMSEIAPLSPWSGAISPQVRGADHEASWRLHQLGVTRVLELEFCGYGAPPWPCRRAGTSPQGEVEPSFAVLVVCLHWILMAVLSKQLKIMCLIWKQCLQSHETEIILTVIILTATISYICHWFSVLTARLTLSSLFSILQQHTLWTVSFSVRVV